MISILRLFFIAVFILTLIPLQAEAALQGYARLSLLEGDVQLKSEGDTEWLPAAVNTPLMEGDAVWCPAGSRAEVQMSDGSVIRLDNQTSIAVVNLEQDFSRFHMDMGHIYVHTAPSPGRKLQFDANDTSVHVSDRSRFRIDITDNGDEEVSIFKGSAYVEGDGGKTRVRTGEMLTLEEGRSEVSPLNPPDAWEGWNRDRDRKQSERRAASPYLPEALSPYASDLEQNGRWVMVPDYGYVWRPTVIFGADWTPYREGRWVWRGDDYVWISYEGWGWAPYHYGRWISVPAQGWCWVPPRRGEVYWAPGYVGWVVTANHVGWVPLAPGEIYYGRGYYGPSSVNITQVNITTVNVSRTVYRNAAIHNGVAFVARDAFVSGRMSYVQPRERIELVMRQRTAAVPDINPRTREARMPVLRSIPAAAAPPPSVGRLPAGAIRERFPRLQEQKAAAPPATGQPARSLERKEAAPARGSATPEREEHRLRSSEERPAVRQQTDPGGRPAAQARLQPAPQGVQKDMKNRRVWNVRPVQSRPAKLPAKKRERREGRE